MGIKKARRGQGQPLSIARRLWTELAKASPTRMAERWLLESSTMSDEDFVAFAARIDVNPNDYSDPLEYRWDAQVGLFLSKLQATIPGIDPLQKCNERFWEAEEMCRETNRRLLQPAHEADVRAVTSRAVNKVGGWLGSRPTPSLLHWGPGSTSSAKGAWVGHNNKLRAKPEGTLDLLTVFGKWLSESLPEWSRFHATERRALNFTDGTSGDEVFTTKFPILNHNTICYVPKSVKTHRTIAIEPHLNVAVQRMIGADLRARMRARGLDLNHQADIQRKLARRGSIDGSLATVDLSMASDTLARRVVDVLCPVSWARLLYVTRTPAFEWEGKLVEYQKLSSMGNGYTWELESMVFYALCLSVCEELGLSTRDVGVFGDDLIVPTDACDLLYRTLAYFGFRPNVEKSFTTGPFRESCGEDYFNGVAVRPVFLRTTSRDAIAALRSLFGIWGEHEPRLASFFALLEELCKAGEVWPWGPVGSSGCIWTDNELLWETRVSHRYQRLQVRIRHFRPDQRVVPSDSLSVEDVLRALEGRKSPFPSDIPLTRDTARKRGRWTYGWTFLERPSNGTSMSLSKALQLLESKGL